MKYNKTPLLIEEQIQRLKSRGLTIPDEQRAAHYLGNISYYRLRAYTYPFQDNTQPDHPFNRKVSFDDIISLYVFDRQLRLQLLNGLEKIEIALRTQIIYHYSIKHGAFWHTNPALFNDSVYFAQHLDSLIKEVNRSKETFISHYKARYTDPADPPCWMSLEVSTMGLLSKIFSNLRKDDVSGEITRYFGLKNESLLQNWMQCFTVLRNICAHHGRVWNRRMTKLVLPKKPLYNFIPISGIYPYKVYAYISAMQYILNIISPGHGFRDRIIALMEDCPLAQEREMGFPENWKSLTFWRQ